MAEAMRRRLASEEGISLVEIMVAFAVLALILLGFAATLTSSLHALVGNESRTKANALANDTLENLQHLPWDEVRDLEDDGAVTETGQGPGGAYTVTTEVAWADDDSIDGDEDYLEFTVALDWEDLGVARTVTHEARRSPPPKEVVEATTVRSIRTDAEIGYLRRNTDNSSVHGRLDDRVEFDEDGAPEVTSLPSNEGPSMLLTTTASVEEIKVEVVDRLGDDVEAELQEENAPEGTEWRLEGTDTNNWRFRNGDNTFKYTVTTEAGTFTMTKVVRYVFEHVRPIDDAEAEPEIVCLDSSGAGEHEVEISVGFWGLTIDDRVEVSGAGLDTAEEWLADHTGADFDGSTFAFVLPDGHEYPDEPETTVELLGVRGFDGNTNLDDDEEDEENPGVPVEVELELLRPDDTGYGDECTES